MSRRILTFLVLGDVLTLAAATLIGFATHQELSTAFMPRMLTTFLPLLAGWFLVAPWLGLFDRRVVLNPRQLWRAVLAMLLGAPMTGMLRAAWLGSTALPLFVLILGSSAGALLLLWRTLFFFWQRRT